MSPVDSMPPSGSLPFRAAGLAVAFVVTLALSCTVFGALFDRVPGIRLDGSSLARRKYEHFAAHKDVFDVVFVGSSQVYRHIDPRLFDEKLAEAGRSVSSFNFGLGGMYFPEVLHSVEWILDQHPAKLKWLFVELRDLDAAIFEENRLSRREINWHSPSVAVLLSRLALGPDVTLSEAFDSLLWAWQHALYRFGNVSLGFPTYDILSGERGLPGALWSSRGHVAIDTELERNPSNSVLQGRRRIYVERPDLYDKYRQGYLDEPMQKEPSALMLEVLSELVETIRARGVEPVFVLPAPGSWSRHRDIVEAAEMGALPCLFAYNDLDAYPELYERENLFELGHLESPGVRRFTTILAEDFIAYLERDADG